MYESGVPANSIIIRQKPEKHDKYIKTYREDDQK